MLADELIQNALVYCTILSVSGSMKNPRCCKRGSAIRRLIMDNSKTHLVGLMLNRGKKEKKSRAAHPPPPPPPPTLLARRKNKSHATHLHNIWVPRRSRSVSRPYKDDFDSSARPMGVASQNSTLLCAITTVPISLPLSSPGDVWPRLPFLFSTWP